MQAIDYLGLQVREKVLYFFLNLNLSLCEVVQFNCLWFKVR